MLHRGIRILHNIEDGLLVIILLSMIALAFSQIVMRNLFDTGIVLLDPLLRIMVLWVALLGALVASRQKKQISVDVLTRILPPGLKTASFIITRAFAAIVSGIIAWHSWLFVIDEWELGTKAFKIVPSWMAELIIPFGFSIIALRYSIQSISGLLGNNQEDSRP